MTPGQARRRYAKQMLIASARSRSSPAKWLYATSSRIGVSWAVWMTAPRATTATRAPSVKPALTKSAVAAALGIAMTTTRAPTIRATHKAAVSIRSTQHRVMTATSVRRTISVAKVPAQARFPNFASRAIVAKLRDILVAETRTYEPACVRLIRVAARHCGTMIVSLSSTSRNVEPAIRRHAVTSTAMRGRRVNPVPSIAGNASYAETINATKVNPVPAVLATAANALHQNVETISAKAMRPAKHASRIAGHALPSAETAPANWTNRVRPAQKIAGNVPPDVEMVCVQSRKHARVVPSTVGCVGNCCEEQEGPGFDAELVKECVCADDSYCCESTWDGVCVAQVESLGCASCDVIKCGDGLCDPNAEDCEKCPQDCGACPVCGDGNCDANENCESCPGDCGECQPACCETTNTPGCPEDPAIEACVCAADFFCCIFSWDSLCVNQVEQAGCGSCP